MPTISAKPDHFLILDVGTTGIKAFVFNAKFEIKARAYRPLKTKRPKRDWVEQDPMEILTISKQVIKEAVRASQIRLNHFAAFGLATQRETVIAWDRVTGRPVYPAIGWEDRRSDRGIKALKGVSGVEAMVREKTGLALDPYFSASKIQWILENRFSERSTNQAIASIMLRFQNFCVGTVDSWLLWNLCEGEPHLTDETNAARTLLFDIKKRQWDSELLKLFGVPREILPEVFPSGAEYGLLKKEIMGARLPVLAVIGDQQASTYAAGIKVGSTKVTYGTGAFLVQSLGHKFKIIPGFFTTLLPTISGQPIFALEAKVENCAASVEPVLKNPKKLKAALLKIARQVDKAIKKLPTKPKFIIADGGVMRDGIIIEQQTKVSDLPVRPQAVFDGTALGVVKLVSEVFKRKYANRHRTSRMGL
ncbi:MAG: FGGY family carbohydrate kinase [Candidatus Uhrbacteria bacterium]